MLLCGRILLGAKSPHVIFPRILARKDYAREVYTLGKFLAMDPSFPEFKFWCQVPLENSTACFGHNFHSSVGIDVLG